jgi:hypothetical protein
MSRDRPRLGGKTMSPTETQFTAELQRIGLNRVVAMEAQRLSCMPNHEFEKALVRNLPDCEHRMRGGSLGRCCGG